MVAELDRMMVRTMELMMVDLKESMLENGWEDLRKLMFNVLFIWIKIKILNINVINRI